MKLRSVSPRTEPGELCEGDAAGVGRVSRVEALGEPAGLNGASGEDVPVRTPRAVPVGPAAHYAQILVFSVFLPGGRRTAWREGRFQDKGRGRTK